MERLKMVELSSVANPAYRDLVLLLEKSRERRKSGRAVVEGIREISLALAAGHRMASLWFCAENTTPEVLLESGICPEHVHFYSVTSSLWRKIAYREGVQNALAVMHVQDAELSGFSPANRGLVVLEGVEKPGNLGAVFRSADAAGIGGIIVCNPAADLWHPNVIRSSQGCVFTMPACVASADACIHWLRDHGYRIITTYMDVPGAFTELALNGKTAVILGTEASGLTDVWREYSEANLRIPMAGRIDSLNVSTAAALIMYEMSRQQR